MFYSAVCCSNCVTNHSRHDPYVSFRSIVVATTNWKKRQEKYRKMAAPNFARTNDWQTFECTSEIHRQIVQTLNIATIKLKARRIMWKMSIDHCFVPSINVYKCLKWQALYVQINARAVVVTVVDEKNDKYQIQCDHKYLTRQSIIHIEE